MCVQPTSYVGCHRDTARICCWAQCRAIDRCLLPAERSAANPPAACSWCCRSICQRVRCARTLRETAGSEGGGGWSTTRAVWLNARYITIALAGRLIGRCGRACSQPRRHASMTRRTDWLAVNHRKCVSEWISARCDWQLPIATFYFYFTCRSSSNFL